MYKSHAEEMRDWLKAYQNNEAYIDQQLEKLRDLKARMRSISSQELSDMPRAPSSPKDKLSEYVIRVDELERSIAEHIKIQDECRTAINQLIHGLDSPKMQKIITFRYLYSYEWTDVARKVYEDKKDWAHKIESYTRRVYRDHERALTLMAKNWTNKS